MLTKLLFRALLAIITPRATNRLADLVLTELEELARRSPSRVDDQVVAHLRRLLTTCQKGRSEP